MTDEHDTKSAPKPARPVPAALLSFIAPGLGLVYVGRPLAGLIVHSLAVLLVLAFVIAATVLGFFPVYPAMVLVAGGLVLSALTAWHSIDIIATDAPQRSDAYHHPLMYALIALLTFYGPLAVTGHFTWRNLQTLATVDQAAMSPQLQAGDKALVDRRIYQNDAPRRGDLVALRHPLTDKIQILRVVAIPGDEVAVQGFTVVINGQIAHYSPVESQALASADLGSTADMELWIERNHDRQYLISLAPGAATDNADQALALEENQFFVLADNRATSGDGDADEAATDSRHFGAIDGARIIGRPTFVGWSSPPQALTPDWERIGLPLR